MIFLNKRRQPETLIYLGILGIVIVSCAVDILHLKAWAGDGTFDPAVITHVLHRLFPFCFLFIINNYLLIPKLISNGRYLKYLFWISILIAAILCWQTNSFFNHLKFDNEPRIHPHPSPKGPRPIVPLPLVLDFICDLMVIGVNLAIALIFQQLEDRLYQERIKKAEAENRLTYLRAQLSPHFYMNMLNNIHGMIEINPIRAQEMVIDMSQLMRYLLYESGSTWISLDKEIDFLKNYLKIMRQRYNEEKVSIELNLPSAYISSRVIVPPLVFLVFIENAFKHGISYSNSSFVEISINLSDSEIMFECRNSISQSHSQDSSTHGIGLQNILQRLSIIYGNRQNVAINYDNKIYTVIVRLPAYETTDSNR